MRCRTGASSGSFRLVAAGILLVAVTMATAGDPFTLSIVHMNDFSARFEEINAASATCPVPGSSICVGGLGRTVTAIKQLLDSRTNAILLNAGDNFSGTLLFNVHRWNITAYFLNMLPFDAMTLGNHEFDDGMAGIVPFLDAITAPVLIANVDNSLEPSFTKFQKSLIIERDGRKIGLIGVIISTISMQSNTGNLIFTDEAAAIREEAALLTEQGVNIIVVISHCGPEVDRQLALNTGPHVDVIVGSILYKFLYTDDSPSTPMPDYPTVVIRPDGGRVLLAQAGAYSKLVGDLVLQFDDDGILQHFEGSTVTLSNDVLLDPIVVSELLPWQSGVGALANRSVGYTKVELSKATCSTGECNLGNLIADSMVSAQGPPPSYFPQTEAGCWNDATIGLVNVGNIRLGLTRGEISFMNLIEAVSYDNMLVCMHIRGDHLLEALEYSVAQSLSDDTFTSVRMLQVSGMRVVYNVTNPVGDRVVSLQLLGNKRDPRRYSKVHALRMYCLVTNTFLANGGDGFTAFTKYGRRQVTGPSAIETLASYITANSPIKQKKEGRITVLK